MSADRRQFLKVAAAATLLSISDIPYLEAAPYPPGIPGETPINVMVPANYNPITTSVQDYRLRLTRATMEYLESSYGKGNLPVWERPLAQIDMEKRLYHITYWIIKGVENYRDTYPVDPAWLIAQIMKESYFYEFAVSSALAVGICQFVEPTATSYEMICAGTRDSHSSSAYRLPELAGKSKEYYEIRSARRQYRRNNKPSPSYSLDEALQIIVDGPTSEQRAAAANLIGYQDRVKSYDEQVLAARDDFRTYLRENVSNLDLFNNDDLQFLLSFDERFTYRKPAFAMVLMMARALRARNGNILAAAIGYNAGLSSTIEDGHYKPYGKIPAIEQSTTYLSHVLVNHFEISKRML